MIRLDNDKVMGAVCLNVHVISAFMPSDFTKFALLNRLEEKNNNYATNQHKSSRI
jgi:hypothetical protein